MPRAKHWSPVPITVRSAYAVIKCTKGQYAKCDVADLPSVFSSTWSAQKNKAGDVYYAYAKRDGKRVAMHYLTGGRFHDHINGDGLDNRRSNLRPCTNTENCRNSRRKNKTGFKGVSENRGKFTARIFISGKSHCLGTFATSTEAAHVYDDMARAVFGAFARTNFKPEGSVA